jgi:2,4-dienoyl-CoA reductase-like NADH-dependent reductase (Old Yellow Enzyme family)/thioredoxin reductase
MVALSDCNHTFHHLFSPFDLGGVELRNRIVMLPITTGFCEPDQSVGDRLVDFYTARAVGGTGLLVVPFSPVATGSPVDAGLYDDRFVPGAQRLTEAIHSHGARVSALLITCYHVILGAGAEEGGGSPEVVGPSPVMNRVLRVTPRELTVEEIGLIVAEYGRAAGRAKRAGFDLVEIMAGGGYLVNRFLSPLSNTRTDAYGGNPARRMRFLLDLVESVRMAVGPDFPITVRLNLQENMQGGYTLDDAIDMAGILEQAGVAGLTSYIGRHESPVPSVQASVPKGAFVHLTGQVKAAVKIPVTAANRIADPLVAERILAEGKADLAGMGRALLADPELPRKARQGRADEIVPCLACSNCLAAMLTTYRQWGKPASTVCTVNPALGKEADCVPRPTPTRKKVMVVGSGPAGLEAARAAALRGHDVRLYEAAETVGGRLRTGAMAPHKEALGALAESLATQALRAGAKLRCRRPVDRQLVERERPDVLVVAVGAAPSMPDIPGISRSNVVLAEEVLSGEKRAYGAVVVVGGGMVGCETAEHIRLSGRAAVTVVEMLERLAGDVPVTTRPFLLMRLREEGVRLLPGTRAVEIDASGVHTEGPEGPLVIPADTVVLATGYAADAGQISPLLGIARETYVIGDCAGGRSIKDALEQGNTIGRSV